MIVKSTDEALMGAVRDGVHSELGELFERHHRALYEFFFRMSSDRATSENLVQDVFSRILKFRDTFREGCAFRPWLYRIARNASHDYDRNNPEASTDFRAAYSDENNPAKVLKSALLQLPEDRRELIVLSQFLGLTPEEIAELLNIDTAAARVRIHQAMVELRDRYRGLPGNPGVEKRHAM